MMWMIFYKVIFYGIYIKFLVFTKRTKKILQTTIYQQIGHSGNNEYIPRNLQAYKTESRGKRKSEQTDYSPQNWSNNLKTANK